MSQSQWNKAITTGGVAEQVLPARLGRSQLIINPITEDCWVRFGQVAAVDAGEKVPSGTSSLWSVQKFPEIGGYVSIFSATTGAKISIRET